MPEMHLKQPRFLFSACGPFAINKGRTQKFKEKGDLRYIYQNDLDKVCFQHDMDYCAYKDLPKRTAPYKVLCNKAFGIASNQQYDGC